MSVLDSIDTTVTIAWDDTRTIGTLIELGGRLAILTALRTPREDGEIHVVVEGDTPDENVAIDGLCTSVSETAWGEQQIEVQLLRVGTTCSASRLRDFIEQYGILRGGSVHIGKNRDNPTSKRFVYHLPETRQGLSTSARGAAEGGRPRRPTVPAARGGRGRGPGGDTADLPSPRHMPSYEATAWLGSSPAIDVRRAREEVARGRKTPREEDAFAASEAGFELDAGRDTLPDAADLALRGSSHRRPSGSFELGTDQATHPDFVLPASLLADGAGDGLNAALQEALQAVEQPRTPGRERLATRRSSAAAPRSPDSEVTVAFDASDVPITEPTSAFDTVESTGSIPTAPLEGEAASLAKPSGAFDAIEADAIEAGAIEAGAIEAPLDLPKPPPAQKADTAVSAAFETVEGGISGAFDAQEDSLSVPSEVFDAVESGPPGPGRRRGTGGHGDTPSGGGFDPSAAFEAVEMSPLTEDAARRPKRAAISELSAVFDAVESARSAQSAQEDAPPPGGEEEPWYAALGDAGQAWAELAEDDPIEVGSAVALEEIEPTRMMQAVDGGSTSTTDIKETANYTGFDSGAYDEENQAQAEAPARRHVSQELLAKIDNAIALERAFADSEHYDPDEPIIVNTVPAHIPFADPVQLGHDNVAPSISGMHAGFDKAPPSPSPAPQPAGEPPRARRARTADRIGLGPLPSAAAEAPEEEQEQAREPPSPLRPDMSEALQKIEQVFGVDLAVRCDLPVFFGVGRKKREGSLLRLAESRLRIESEHQPGLYERLDVVIPLPQGGKAKVTVNCEVTRIREPDEEGALIAFDMRLASSNPPKQMNALRDLIRSLEGDAA